MAESIRRFKGGDGAVGDERLFLRGSTPPFRTIAGRDWLASGAVVAYASKHAALAAACPGLVAVAMPASFTLPSGSDGFHALLHNGTGYFAVASGAAPGVVTGAYATTLAGLAAGDIGAAGNLTRARAACVVDTRMVVVGDTGAHGAVYYNAGAWGICGGVSAVSLLDIASKGTDAVAIADNQPTGGTLTFYTTADGAAFTLQAGSGGPSFVPRGIVWCPVASLYLIYGATQMNSSANGYSGQTACTLPSGVTFPQHGSRSSASSAGVTLIKLTDNRLLRTVDGVAFTVVDLLLENLPVGTLGDIVYDGTRFIAQINNGGSAASAFVYSTTGASGSWTASPAFDDAALPGSQNWQAAHMCIANSKWIIRAKQPGGAPALGYDMSGIAWPLVPTRVGALKERNDGDSQVYIRVT